MKRWNGSRIQYKFKNKYYQSWHFNGINNQMTNTVYFSITAEYFCQLGENFFVTYS